MTWQETVTFLGGCMPRQIGRALLAQPEGSVREIRLRAGGHGQIVTCEGAVSCLGKITQQQVSQTAEALCDHALYARAEEQRQGFVTLRGGHRMGLCGRVIAQGQSVRALRDISSLCIRVAGQWRGAADGLMPYLTDSRVCSTLIIGLPGMGKTTLLRDACRRLSEDGVHLCVVDERSEIAAMSGGVAQLDVGPNTDVLDGCAKEAGLRWLVRSMSPDVLVTDELGGPADAQAAADAVRSGVAVLATLHGRDLESALSRASLYHLAQCRVFDRYAVLDDKQVGRVKAVYDAQLKPMNQREAG